MRLYFCRLCSACIPGFWGTLPTFSGIAELHRSSRHNFTKILQFRITPGLPIVLVLPSHLCHFGDRHQRQQHLFNLPAKSAKKFDIFHVDIIINTIGQMFGTARNRINFRQKSAFIF
ncbi:hypothetical protein QUB60_24960 [Microcoleus sp. A2-C5]|uniref:hypothetical protein n=1 Tax=Microcoleaceae TaxID=1892252 RepID=UPI0022388C5D|nr:hypothetical protein [Lyngbya sp. CCAP 1446/10]MCW6051226.1 hypothetical protein [Lyngbya sp. CCAP 1446/10]